MKSASYSQAHNTSKVTGERGEAVVIGGEA
jgi:hypothetical protein